ncbi:MAG: ComEA family DNA-binding protein [Polyangiaceae bacterium]
MSHGFRAPDARPSSEGRAQPGRLREFFVHPWAKLGVRALVALGGLVVLVLIGSNARAVPSAAPSGSTSTIDPRPSTATVTATATIDPRPSTSTVDPRPSTSPLVEHARRATPDDPVHLNSAAIDDLERLPSIGPKRAAAILNLRMKLGRFR